MRRGLNNCRRCPSYPQQSFQSTFKSLSLSLSFCMALFVLNGFGTAGWENTETRGNGDVCHCACYNVRCHADPSHPQDDSLLIVSIDIPEDSLFICEHKYSWSSLIHNDATLPAKCYTLVDGYNFAQLKNANALNFPNTRTILIDYLLTLLFFFSKFCGERGERNVLKDV